MKYKTKFYLSLVFILIGGFMIEWNTSMMGIIVIGLFSYLAGVFSTKANIEEEMESHEIKKIL